MKFPWSALVVLWCFFGLHLSGQEVVQGISTGPAGNLQADPLPGWNVHVAYTYAVVNNRYEVQRQYKPGIGLGAVYRFGQWFSLEGAFSRYQRHNALSLEDIQSWTADLNAQLSMRIGKSDLYFRMIFGGGYVDWKGYYVGPNLNDNYHYYFGKLLKDQFYTANIGWGFGHYFCKQRLEGFSDFRVRFAADPRVMFSIRDTQIQIGLRYSLYREHNDDKDKANGKSGNASRRPNSEKKRRVYKWMKNR